MRIIAGKYRGKTFSPPKGLPVRPTKDRAKEALFNILEHRFGVEDAVVLDCFAGTGNLTFEFLSRGAEKVVAVEQDTRCAAFIKKIVAEINEEAHCEVVRAEVRHYLQKENEAFGIIFMDPPYAMDRQEELILLCFERKLLLKEGLLILEHSSRKSFSNLPNFIECRKYGDSSFSLFQNQDL